MQNINKYRLSSVRIMILMVVFFLMSYVSLWNIIHSNKTRYIIWNVILTLLLFLCAFAQYYIARLFTDEKRMDRERQDAYEKGKAEILMEIEKRNLKEKEDKEQDQEEIQKTVSDILNGLKSARQAKLANKILSNIAKNMGIVQGILYMHDPSENVYKPEGTYALTEQPSAFAKGEGLAGQVAESMSPMVIYDIPEQYFRIESALGSSKPGFLLLSPVVYENECLAVLELAIFSQPTEMTGKILQNLSTALGPILHTSFAA
jgi:hypothetical protein